MMRRFVVAMLIGACLLSACQTPYTIEEVTIEPEVTESLRRFERVYALSPGDAVDVLVRGNDAVSRSVVIRPDGFLSLPLLGDVRAEGRAVPELTEELTVLFSERLRDPEVTVIATQVREPMVYVLGEVQQPQPVPHRSAHTAAQAISVCGGFNLTAHKRAVAIIRLTEEGHLRAYTIPVEIEGKPAPYLVLQGKLLQPDDIVYVPPSDIAQVNRFIDDHINKPLSGVNSVLSPAANFFFIRELIRD